MKIALLRGPQALAALDRESFQTGWRRLYDGCPWATCHQGMAFINTWYRVYADVYEPLIAVGTASDPELRGLWFFAVERASDQLVPAGTIHAEYHAWLSSPEDADPFALATLGALKREHARTRRLTFLFMAPGCPMDWLAQAPRVGVHGAATPQPRGLLPVGADGPVTSSLRKRSNKSRLARLNRIGPVSFAQLHTRGQLEEVMPTIIEHCDARHGASRPFQSDPHKRELYLAMMERPGLLHATVLRVGDQLAAAHLGPIHRRSVSLGLIAHSPEFASHSPGKFAILFLARMLGEQGFEYFDLTPGGDYKERFAHTWDEAQILELSFRWIDHAVHSTYRASARVVKPALERLGYEPSRLKRRVIARLAKR